jgi:polysaccharide biosynthesis transport protein
MPQEFRKYLNLILRHRVLFVAVCLLTGSAGVVIGYLLPEKYQGKATIYVEKSLVEEMVKGFAVTSDMDSRIRVLNHTLGSRPLLTKVLQQLGFDTSDPDKVTSLVARFSRNIEVEMMPERGRKDHPPLFMVKYVDRDPRFARDFVNTLVQVYIDENVQSSRQASHGATLFMQQQADSFRQRIQAAELKIAEFRQQEGYELIFDEPGLMAEIRRIQLQLEEMDIHRNELLAKQRIVSHSQSREGAAGGNLLALENRRDQLLLQYTENYPEVVLVEAEIERLRRQLAAASRTQPAASAEGTSLESAIIDIELQGMERRQEQLQKTLDEYQLLLTSLPQKRKVLRALEQERDSHQKTYEQLVARYGQSEISAAMETQDKAGAFRMIEPALLPRAPVSPDRFRIILGSLFAGLGVGFAAAVLRDRFDLSVRGLEVLRELNMPVLAVIPQHVSNEERRREQLVNTGLIVLLVVFLGAMSLLAVAENYKLLNRRVAATALQETIQHTGRPPSSQLSVEGGLLADSSPPRLRPSAVGVSKELSRPGGPS